MSSSCAELYFRDPYILCYLYVVYDLACFPLLVAILAEYMLVTPTGSIYAR
jgi:hypothetical protein